MMAKKQFRKEETSGPMESRISVFGTLSVMNLEHEDEEEKSDTQNNDGEQRISREKL